MGLTHAWHQFRDAPAGERFRREHARARDKGAVARTGLWLGGLALIAAGVVMLFIPGPGIVAIALGLALVATASRRLATWLDLGECRLRAWRRERG